MLEKKEEELSGTQRWEGETEREREKERGGGGGGGEGGVVLQVLACVLEESQYNSIQDRPCP